MLEAFESREVRISEVVLRRPTLDDVFLALTGASAEAAEAGKDTPAPAKPGRRGRGSR